jgi:hypothetical protein
MVENRLLGIGYIPSLVPCGGTNFVSGRTRGKKDVVRTSPL